jgi:hypothetical protein
MHTNKCVCTALAHGSRQCTDSAADHTHMHRKTLPRNVHNMHAGETHARLALVKPPGSSRKTILPLPKLPCCCIWISLHKHCHTAGCDLSSEDVLVYIYTKHPV